jgi:putative ATPase
MDFMQSSMFDSTKPSPLADRVRPRNLEEYVGQDHILGKGRILRKEIESDQITSMILWGPPGVGKTTLAMIIAKLTNSNFVTFSAVTSGIKEIREVMTKAEYNRYQGIRTLLFIDEIHRFNKAQQDAFLPHVEKGNIVLIGTTTENPSFEINSALLSRSRVFILHCLDIEDIVKLLKNAITDDRGYGNKNIFISNELLHVIAIYSNGDARTALNTLEMAVINGDKELDSIQINKEIIEGCIQKKSLLYDKNGEEHYNLISALHKSMRNSDPDASLYWLARMLEAGEDPLYIVRRMIRFASEDIGLADPKALEMMVAVYNSAHFLGMPECNVNLAQGVVYLALAPKSNALYSGYEMAKTDALDTIAEGVPIQLRNAPTSLMKNIGYGKDYKYAHDFENKTTDMQCLPDNLKGKKYYSPTPQGFEKNLSERMETLEALKHNLSK